MRESGKRVPIIVAILKDILRHFHGVIAWGCLKYN